MQQIIVAVRSNVSLLGKLPHVEVAQGNASASDKVIHMEDDYKLLDFEEDDLPSDNEDEKLIHLEEDFALLLVRSALPS